MKKTDILRFLQDNPDFLAQHAEALGIRVGESKVRAFSEARIAAVSKKIDTMAQHMVQMTENAEYNLATMQRLMRLNLALMGCNTLKQVEAALAASLNEDFKLPQFALALTQKPAKKLRVPEALNLPENDAARNALRKLTAPLCATRALHKHLEKRLPDAVQAESFLHLPLRHHDTLIGVLLIGHPDPQYFAPDAPTEYVALMGDALAATLARIMGLRPT